MIKEVADDFEEIFENNVNIKKEDKKKSITSEDGIIEFVCNEEDYGVIPDPIPANKVLPDWYKSLEGKVGPGTNKSTVKRCMPFLDALTKGWIMPLAGEVEFYFDESTGDFGWESQFPKGILDTHPPSQIGGDENPMSNMPIIKFINHWSIKVPDGYSVLYTSPFNRYEPRFEPFSGIVDCDSYFNNVNFPAIWTGGDWRGVIEKGTPIVQVIPFKRDNDIGDAIIRSMDDEETKIKDKTARTITTEESTYRNDRWQSKNASRVVEKEKMKKCPVTGAASDEYHGI